jgi:glycosyltransferase involved in cell wall biosynthesis
MPVMPLKVCILASQYFDWGIYGGFGSMSRKLAEALAQAGHRVTVIIPRRPGQAAHDRIGGVDVSRFSPFRWQEARDLIRQSSADLFHSQDPTLITYLAQRIHPNRVHLVTCRDPRDWTDWATEFRFATAQRRLLIPFNYVTESGPMVKTAVRRADGVYCPAHFLKEKAQRIYGLSRLPEFLPNLIDVPAELPKKSDRPTMTFIARWDPRKRPWLFFELAKRFPDYRFIAVGQGSASAESRYDADLREQYRRVPNVIMTGLINRFTDAKRMEEILSETWVLVSTAAREGLPLTFLEAAAYGCAILSAVDPDEFATRFGARVQHDDFAAELQGLMRDDPLGKGRRAREYVRRTYETSIALAAHLDVYHSFMGRRRESRPWSVQRSESR